MQRVWRIELLGTLTANREAQTITRFRTRRVASLLAYLAYFQQRVHSRDEICEMLWPDAAADVSRRNLRQALLSLRHALEPAPLPHGSVVLSIQDGLQLSTDTVTTDVAEFEALIKEGKKGTDPTGELKLLREAVAQYKGDLLPGYTDEWIWSHRLRLEDMYLFALKRLGALENPESAIGHLRLGVIREPFNEQWHLELMRLYLAVEMPEKAVQQFAELEQALSESFGQNPSEPAKTLLAKANDALGTADSKLLGVPIDRRSEKPPQRRLSLPVFANRYFGRIKEIELICANLEQGRSRLVTILGPAGVGKTRLSVQCAWSIAERQDWNIWFVPLADRFKASELFEAIVAALDSNHGSSSSEIDRIVELTSDRQTLLVLDNLEQIADDAGLYLAELLERVSNISLLTSSRQALQVRGEQAAPIEPLPLPPEDRHGSVEFASVPSIELFMDRCQAIRPDLQLNERNASAIVELCRRLDGLPLAIEIAAGLSNSYSPVQMLHQLTSGITGLKSRSRDVPERHRSLRTAIDWTYDTLSPELKALFRQVSVFRGGFIVDAVNAVCFDGKKTEDCSAALLSLQERSLVRSQPRDDGGPPRFMLLTVFREYAEEQTVGEELRTLRDSHADFFARQTPPSRPFATVEEQTAQHLAIELDYDNFTAAIEYSLEAENLERCARLLAILSTRWLSRGPKSTERRLIRQIAEHPKTSLLSAELRVQVQRMLGTTYIRSGEYLAAYESCARAVQIASDEGDAQLTATCYSGLSICAGYLGRLEESLELNRSVLRLVGNQNLHLAERSYLGMGSAFWNLGQIDDAAIAFEKARGVSVRLRGGEPDALIVINQARLALDTGRNGEALRLAHEAIRISRRLHDEFTLAVALTVVSRYHLLGKNFEAASATNLEALDKCKQGDFLFWILQCLRNQALIWVGMGRFAEAATLLAATVDSASGDRKFDAEEDGEAVARIRGALSPRVFESAWAKGLGMDRGEALRFVAGSKPD